MLIAGYIASVFIGLSLGLIGGGGSILTVPVLVYLMGVNVAAATTYSLFVVGSTSVVGSVSYFRNKAVDVRIALLFGVPSVVSVFFTRKFIVPAIPQIIFEMGGFVMTKSILLMLLFALLMVLASYSMIRKSPTVADDAANGNDSKLVRTILQGLLVGMVTGMVGAGGGFLIIPALVNLLKVPMKTAVGTSLVIISINSLLGFLFSIGHIYIDWLLLLTVTGIAIAGILAGSYLAKKIDGKKLKPAFGWFVLVMGLYIIVRESLLK